jgi:hypothetical protein
VQDAGETASVNTQSGRTRAAGPPLTPSIAKGYAAREKTYLPLTTNLRVHASNNMENKNRKAPGLSGSDRSDASKFGSNPNEVAVLYFDTRPNSAAGENGAVGAKIEEQ